MKSKPVQAAAHTLTGLPSFPSLLILIPSTISDHFSHSSERGCMVHIQCSYAMISRNKMSEAIKNEEHNTAVQNLKPSSIAIKRPKELQPLLSDPLRSLGLGSDLPHQKDHASISPRGCHSGGSDSFHRTVLQACLPPLKLLPLPNLSFDGNPPLWVSPLCSQWTVARSVVSFIRFCVLPLRLIIHPT